MSKAKLYQKILRAKANFDPVIKDSKNPFFKSSYADINTLLDATEPALEKEGLLVLQPPEGNKVTTYIVDTETGEMISSSLDMPQGMTDPQKVIAMTTYYRRGTYQGLLGLKAQDDDGETATGRGKLAPKAATVPAPKVEATPAPAAEQHSYKKKLGSTSNGVSNGVAKSTSNPWDGA